MKNEKNEQIKDQPQADEKKQYAKPQLIKHGNVEALTHSPVGGPSGPLQV